MTEKDKVLIEKAKSLNWEEAATLESQAESEDARRTIHDIAVRGGHFAEAQEGVI